MTVPRYDDIVLDSELRGSGLEVARVALTPEQLARLERLAAGTRRLADQSKAKNTRRAYRADWHAFRTFCEATLGMAVPAEPRHGDVLPVAQVVALFLADEYEVRERARNTVARRLTGVSHYYRAAGLPSPRLDADVAEILAGVRRDKRDEPDHSSRPLSVEELLQITPSAASDVPVDVRDRALILFGVGGAFRRSELVAVQRHHLTLKSQGVIVRLPRSKTNQTGGLEHKPIHRAADEHRKLCPVGALQAWLRVLDAHRLSDGAVFRHVTYDVSTGARRFGNGLSPGAVSLILKRRAAETGVDPRRLAGHSLRHTFVSLAAEHKYTAGEIARVTGHRKLEQVETYRKGANPFTGAARAL